MTWAYLSSAPILFFRLAVSFDIIVSICLSFNVFASS